MTCRRAPREITSESAAQPLSMSLNTLVAPWNCAGQRSGHFFINVVSMTESANAKAHAREAIDRLLDETDNNSKFV